LHQPIEVPAFFKTGVIILLTAALMHFLFVAIFGRLPRVMGWVLSGLYLIFLWVGLLN
jgi:cation:H+ antiporter